MACYNNYMKNTQKGFMSLIGMIATLAVVGLMAYMYLSKNKETGTSQHEENKAAIESTEEAKRLIESRQIEY